MICEPYKIIANKMDHHGEHWEANVRMTERRDMESRLTRNFTDPEDGEGTKTELSMWITFTRILHTAPECLQQLFDDAWLDLEARIEETRRGKS